MHQFFNLFDVLFVDRCSEIFIPQTKLNANPSLEKIEHSTNRKTNFFIFAKKELHRLVEIEYIGMKLFIDVKGITTNSGKRKTK